ncbi:MAG: DUF4175 family protein [Syntrophothermus sp.]
MNTQSYYKEILNKFDKLNRRESAGVSLYGIQIAVSGIAGLFLLLSLLELVFNFSSAVRTGLFLVFLIVSFGLLLYQFLYPAARSLGLIGRTSYDKTARKVGLLFPSIKDDLLNAMQLVNIETGKTLYSESLKEAAFRQVYLKTENVDFSGAVKFERPKKLFKYTISLLLFTALMFLFVPGLSAASYRLTAFNRDFIPPAKFLIDVKPGSIDITKGEDLKITARIKGPKPSEVMLSIKYPDQTDFDHKQLTADSTGLYSFEVTSARNSFDYYVSAEDVKSTVYKINVVDKPIIRNLSLKVTQPAYSRLPEIEQTDNGNVTALTGSVMNFSIQSTKELKTAYLQFSDTTRTELKTNGRSAEGTYRIKGDLSYRIVITDMDGHTNDDPVSYSIKTMTDLPPAIEIVAPAKDVLLGQDDRLPLLLKISDDYGFSRLLIHYRLSASKRQSPQNEFSSLELPLQKQLKDQDINYIWNLAPQMLSANDVVSYYLEVFDNDVISGPKSAKTAMFNVRVPSLDELYQQADNTQKASENKMAETLNEAQKLKENLEKLSQEMRQDKKDITWQEKEKVEKSMQQFNQLSQKMDDVKKDLAKMQNDLQQNNLLSKETLQKYMELQDLFKQLSSEEMKKAMEKMQTALQQMNRDMVQQNLEQMKFDEDMFKKSIERTLKLLKRAQAEQKMDELVKRTDELTEKIDQVKKETQQSNLNDKNQKQQLKNEQNEVTDDLKQLDQKMDELKNRMNELEDMPKDMMQKAMEEFDRQQNEQTSEQAEQQIDQMQKQQAQQNQQKLSQNMKKNKQSMSGVRQQMQRQNQMQAFNEMRKILDNLLTLSKDQENLKNQTPAMDQNTNAFKENARKQSALQGNMDKIMQQMTKTSQKTFAITPEMGRSLGKANNSMRQSISDLQNRNSFGAQAKQTEAMASLNEAAAMLKRSMQNMMDGGQGQGGGMMSLMQQLQQMSQQQMNLNNMTQQMNKGQLSMQQQAEFQRLAQQQELIRKSLEQLNKESRMEGQSKKLPANLDNVEKEMHEIVSELRNQNSDQNVVQKQERILSKLLEAQRSINDRDFEKERESNSGKQIAGKTPGPLNLPAQRRNRMKDELQKAVQEGYSRDYENLIRKYYESLQKQNP